MSGFQSDFIALLRSSHPGLLPPSLRNDTAPTADNPIQSAPHGTTILAVRFEGGVLIAGDRRATAGYEIAERSIEKVFELDAHSSMAIAGVAGPATQMAKLLRTQLEFYEKVEGIALSLEGKANYLAHLVQQNLPAAMQGLVIVPILAGYDQRRRKGRIFKYDPVGGRYEELDFFATGSGGKDASGALKKRYRAGFTQNDAVRASVEALLDASDEDTATGGFDFVRGIFPIVKTITVDGTEDAPESRIREMAEAFIDEWRADFTARRAPTE